MQADELRRLYLKFFKEKNHEIIPSASLIPENDPTVLFTSAGMQPLVPYLLGQPHPQGNRLADCQKCVRTTDIDEAGDTSHLTFIEMLGNWSLNDYWKEEAIKWSYEFLTSKKWLGFDPERLSVTVFAGDADAPRDEEAARLWLDLGMPEERIFFLPKEDNWWGPAGTIGPCGPCTEMFIRIDEVPLCGPDCRPGCSCGAYFEIWNDVFLHYNKKEDGSYEMMDRRNIDTGMGLERTVAMLQGKKTIYEIPLLQPLMDKIKEFSEKDDFSDEDVRYQRIVADHVRSAVMIMADDRRIAPSNVEHGYIVRRLLRKSIHSAGELDCKPRLIKELAEIVIGIYKDIYDEVGRNRDFIMKNIEEEESKFKKTLGKAIRKFERILSETGTVTGKDAFLLFTSFGLPLEMTRDLAEERGIEINLDEFRKEFEHHREISRTATQGRFKGGLSDYTEEITMLHTATHLLQEALRRVLGDEVQQMGSNITQERLRFDFTFSRKLTQEEVKQVEDMVNEVIQKDLEVTQEFMSLDDALASGALAFFKETYGDEVSVYSVVGFSKEICGGPHVEKTGVLGHFKIAKQKKIGAGIIRIRAILQTEP